MGLDNDKELVEIIRSVTDKPLCVDANQGWKDKEKALEMIEWLSERNTLFVEQPLPKEMIDETAWIRERSPLPIMADEFLQRLPDVRRAEGVYDGINIKLMKSTGLREAYKMAVLAKALGNETDDRMYDRDFLRYNGGGPTGADDGLGRPGRQSADFRTTDSTGPGSSMGRRRCPTVLESGSFRFRFFEEYE